MKINYVKINGFGKIKNKFLKFEDGINVIYGENETGKSSIVKFIASSLYGISKNKNGKLISDFDQYTPWDNSEFSGKINYEINNQNYEVFREFNKKNPKIYNVRGEDISKTFPINKSKEIEFFLEQSKIDENTFLNTTIIEQENIEIKGKNANSIVQKLSNLVSTGDDNISFQKCLNKIEKEQIDIVGTEKTKNRPINVIENDIYKLQYEKKEIENYKEKFENDLINRDKTLEELNMYQTKKMCAKSVKRLNDDFKLKEAEIEFNKKIENEYIQKLEQLNNQKEKIKNEKNNKNSKSGILTYIILVIALIISILAVLYLKKKIAILIPIILLGLIFLFINTKKNKTIKSQIEKVEKIQSEFEKIEDEYEEKKSKRKEEEAMLFEQKDSSIIEIINEFREKIDDNFIKKIFEMNDVQLEKYIDELENSLKNSSIQYKLIQNEIENIDSKLERLVVVEEELENKKEEKADLVSLNVSYNIAKECLEEAYNEIKNNLSPKFEKKLCDISSKITNGKYENIILNEENGLFVEIENGNYMPIDRLSVGTIDELYLALRLSILEEISSDEKMPIIFDETFAYFDDNRLENTIKYLLENNYENQILIFSCSNREEEILNKLKIEYNIVKLEKS